LRELLPAGKLQSAFPEQLELVRRNILASYNLDGHGRALHQAHDEEDASRQQQHDAIVLAMKRRQSETFSALSFAATMGEVEEVRKLIRRGVDINGTNYDRRTALHMSAAEGNLRVVELLLEHGATKDLKSRWGRTPLAEAVYEKQTHVVAELLKQDCRLDLDDPAGKT
jgi:ankyrin repeat protein